MVREDSAVEPIIEIPNWPFHRFYTNMIYSAMKVNTAEQINLPLVLSR